MSWQKEIDELRHREALARKMGGKEKIARHHNQGKLTVRERIDGLVDAGSFHEIGTATRRCRIRRGRPAQGHDADQLSVRACAARRAARRHRRRRFHGARWGERRGQSGKGACVRAHGARPAPADRAPDRRHRRRRLGQEYRDQGAHPVAGLRRPKMGLHGREPGDGAGGVAGAWVDRRARRGAGRGEPLFGHRQGHGTDVRRRAAGGGADRPGPEQERTWRQRDPHAQRCDRRRSRERVRCLRPRPQVLVLPAAERLRRAAARPARGRPGTQGRLADLRDPAQTAAKFTRCGRSSTPWSTRGRSSRSARSGAAR